MKIVFAGGGTGGHFYPLIAIAEGIADIVQERALIQPRLYYLAPSVFDEEALLENQIQYIYCPAGKVRRYFSLLNVTDFFATVAGIISALLTLFRLYPDIVVSKGGYASVPVTIAAHLLGIPVLIHESDAKPGRANLLASKYAKRIATTFPGTENFFPANVRKNVARTGIPVRKSLMHTDPEGAKEEYVLDTAVPTVLILGGSLGAQRINENVLLALPELVGDANIIHQTGAKNIVEVEASAKVVLEKSTHKARYHSVGYLSALSLRRAAAIADLIVSRAGATAVAEIALWSVPALLIPIPEDVSHDQRTNAYSYAETGAAIVIEEANLSPHVLASEVHRVLADAPLRAKMKAASQTFRNTDAAKIIADEVISIALSHEK